MRRLQLDPAAYGLDGVVEPLGWLAYEQAGNIYRTCHVGLSSMLTPHPSCRPFERMAAPATGETPVHASLLRAH